MPVKDKQPPLVFVIEQLMQMTLRIRQFERICKFAGSIGHHRIVVWFTTNGHDADKAAM